MLRWFTPAPWKTTKAVLDVRAGGSNLKEGERGTRRAYGTHEDMGFHDGWGAATDQLVATILPLVDATE